MSDLHRLRHATIPLKHARHHDAYQQLVCSITNLDGLINESCVKVAGDEASTNPLDLVRSWGPTRDDW